MQFDSMAVNEYNASDIVDVMYFNRINNDMTF